MEKYDLIIVGGGHAGVEAALISAKKSFNVLLITMDKQKLCEMSCNPAIGGLAKGHLVKEIDALGGVMGIAIDENAIQYRLLNTRKGSAVRSSRAQADRFTYVNWFEKRLKKTDKLTVEENKAEELIIDGTKVLGVICADGKEFRARKIILCTGTFLYGKMFIGDEVFQGGRWGESSKVSLSNSLKKLGISLGRLKTGTPARLDKDSIAYDKCIVQNGDEVIEAFSFLNDDLSYDQTPCFITYTNSYTHEIIRKNISRSPLFAGKIKGVGPRYCPSIEDKVIRFPDKDRHQIFLEPEGRNSIYIYPNGISTSLPKDVQEDFIHSIEGLEDAKILRYGYAVEYDFVIPTQLDHSLKVKNCENLYLAGQINGTSGYEEAGGQGLVAGINACNEIEKRKPINIKRYNSYLGVLIDDLVVKGTDEPYRMFTSRAEHRLILREDNADQRLTPLGIENSCVEEGRSLKFQEKMLVLSKVKEFLGNNKIYPNDSTKSYLNKKNLAQVNKTLSLKDYLKRGYLELNLFEDLLNNLNLYEKWLRIKREIKLSNLSRIWQTVQADFYLEGYIERENEKISRIKYLEEFKIPSNFQYKAIQSLTNEVKEKLINIKPRDLSEALSIPGLTPAAIDVLMIQLKKQNICTNF